MHDGMMRVASFVLAVDSGIVRVLSDPHWRPEELVHATGEWLRRRRRLIELHTGELIVSAYWVRLEGEKLDRVAEVLHASTHED